MGQNNSTKMKILCLWFDKHPNSSSNKKLQDDINQLFKYLNKNKEISIKLFQYTSFELFQDITIIDERIKSIFIITSGSLKNKVFEKFNPCLKVKAIIVYCFKKEIHRESFMMSPKIVLLTEKANEVVNQIESLYKDIIFSSNVEKKHASFSMTIPKNFISKEQSIFNKFKYVFIDDLRKPIFSLCSAYDSMTDKFTNEEFYLCRKLVKVEKNNISEVVDNYHFQKEKLLTENQLEEAIKLLKIDLDPEKDFEQYKSKIIQEFFDEDFLKIDNESIQETYVQHFEKIDKIDEFFHMLFYLFTINLNNNSFFIRINNILKNNDYECLSKFKHIFSALIINFFPQFSKKTDYYENFYHLLIQEKLVSDDVNNCKVLINPQFHFASISNKIKNKNISSKISEFLKKIYIQYIVSKSSYLMNSFLNLNEYSKLTSEKDIIFCPLTKFTISKVIFDPTTGKYLIKMKIQENNIFYSIFPFNFLFRQVSNFGNTFVNQIQSYQKFLKHFYNKKETIIIQANFFNLLANYYSFNKSYNLSLYFFEKLIKLCGHYQKLDNNIINFNKIGKIYEILGKYQKAIEIYSNHVERLLIKKSKSTDDIIFEELISCYCNIANIYKNTGEFKKAISYFEIAFQFFKNQESKEMIINAKILNLMGITYHEFNKSKQSLEIFHYAKEMLNDHALTSNSLDNAILLNNIGMTLLESREYKKALDYLIKSKEIKLELEADEIYLSNTYNNIGCLYIYMEEYDEAIKNFNESMRITYHLMGKENYRIYDIIINIAFCHYLRGDNNESLNFYNRAIVILTDIKPDNYLEQISKLKNFIDRVINF